MPVLRLFASAREAAGLARAELDGATVGEVLTAASALYGERFAAVLARSRIWVNGEPATDDTPVTGHDVVAVLPPVSGGAGESAAVLEREVPLEPGVPPGEPAATEPPPAESLLGPPPEPTPPEPTPPAPLPVAASAAAPVPAPASPPAAAPPVRAPNPLPVAAPRSAPAPTPASPPVPAPPSTPVEASAAPPAPVPAPAAAPPPRPPTPVVPMAGLGGARVASPAALAPRDPPIPSPPAVPAPPPAPAAPRPGEIGGAAISPPPPAEGVAAASLDAPETPPEARSADEQPKEDQPKEDDRAGARSLARFAVVYDVDRPHGRIGLAWAAVTVAAVFGGKVWLAAWLGVAAFVGASQTAAARRALEERPPPWLAALTAVGPPVAALYSGMHLVGAVVAGLAAALLVRTLANGSLARDVSVAVLIGVATGTAAASVVATRGLGLNPAFFLLACAAVYDVGAYLIGTGAGAVWEGPVAGMVGILPVTILAGVLLVPPFPAGGPLLLGVLAVALAPLGPLLATALVGDRELDAPGLRRLDSLLLLGPMWAWVATRLIG